MQRSAIAILFVTVAAFCAPARSAEYSDAVKARIAKVERGLRPSVRVKGKSATWSLEERMKHHHVPAVSIAVIDDYQLAWAMALGLADTEPARPASTETLFQAASVSKPVSALAALRLVQDGKLHLDRNVNEQLTSWKVPDNKYTAEHAVDLRGLLSHTAGLTVHGFPGYKPDDPLPSVPQILDGAKPANTAPVRVNKVPGNGFRYSGGGTTIAQLLVMDVTGEPYADFLQRTVLQPLGMTASNFRQPLSDDARPRAASGHDKLAKPIDGRVRIHPELAAAGLWTTPSELANYIIEVQLAHEGRSAKVISQKTVDEMLTPQGGGSVGLGPFLAEKDGQRRFSHGGQNLGFSCQFVGYLDRGQGAVVMTNSDVGAPLVAEVLNAIAAEYHWPGYLESERDAIRQPAETLARYVGKYNLGPLGNFEVRREGDRLWAKAGPDGLEFELYFETPTEFFSDYAGTRGRFVVAGDQPASEVVVLRGDREQHLKRIPE